MVEKRTGKKLILSLQEAPDITISICVTFHTVMQNMTERLENIAARRSSRCDHRMGCFVTLLRLSITPSPFSPLTVASNGGWHRCQETCTQQTEHWLSGVPSPRRLSDQQVLWIFSKAAASGEEREKDTEGRSVRLLPRSTHGLGGEFSGSVSWSCWNPICVPFPITNPPSGSKMKPQFREFWHMPDLQGKTLQNSRKIKKGQEKKCSLAARTTSDKGPVS